mgnify:CR=1 FL=1
MVASIHDGGASLADVLPSCLAALGIEGFTDRFTLGIHERIVLFVVDGLGWRNLEMSRGYARFLGQREPVDTLRTVFPSTTASALASLVTGTQPNQHGILGYRVWSESRGELVNQLNGIDDREVHGAWLTMPSLVCDASSASRAVTVLAHERYRTSALTKMLYTDARYIGTSSIGDAFDKLGHHLAKNPAGLTIVYLAQLDETAHRCGVNSYEWCGLLEELDAHLRDFSRACPGDTLALLTADHGVVDVPASAHREFGLGPEMKNVRAIGGEPRCLQIYANDHADVSTLMSEWSTLAGDSSLVRTVADLEASEWLAASNPRVSDRLPDFYVFAPESEAWYDGREPTSTARNMIGQHGGISAQETSIPLLRVSAR